MKGILLKKKSKRRLKRTSNLISQFTLQYTNLFHRLDEFEEALFSNTVHFWQRWMEKCTYKGRWREMVRHLVCDFF